MHSTLLQGIARKAALWSAHVLVLKGLPSNTYNLNLNRQACRNCLQPTALRNKPWQKIAAQRRFYMSASYLTMESFSHLLMSLCANGITIASVLSVDSHA